MNWNPFQKSEYERLDKDENIPEPVLWQPYQPAPLPKITKPIYMQEAEQNNRFINCLSSAAVGAGIGFGAAGGLALVGGGIFALASPYVKGQRARFFMTEVTKMVLKSGGAFGGILGIGGYLRCL